MKTQANSEVRARVNEHIKSEAIGVLTSMGLTVSDAIRILLTSIAKQKTLPTGMLKFSGKTLRALEDADKGITKKFKNVEALMKDLNAGD